MKPIFRSALAITLLAGLNLSASAGVLSQDVTPMARLGTNLQYGIGSGSSSVVVPMPAQLLPFDAAPMPAQLLPFAVAPMPAPLPSAIENAAEVPEPGTVATLAVGLALMGALARRRRPIR